MDWLLLLCWFIIGNWGKGWDGNLLVGVGLSAGEWVLVFGLQFLLGWGVDWGDVDGVGDLLSLLNDEGLVLADLLLPGWDVDVVVDAVNDLVVDDVGEVLETVELDLVSVAVVDLEWVGAGAAGA